jgi:hypothetical protein
MTVLDFQDLGQEFKAGNHRHLLVGDDDGEGLLLEDAEGVDGVRGRHNLVALAQQGVAQGHQNNLLVIHDQDGRDRLGRFVRIDRHQLLSHFGQKKPLA